MAWHLLAPAMRCLYLDAQPCSITAGISACYCYCSTASSELRTRTERRSNGRGEALKKKGRRGDLNTEVETSGPTTVPVLVPKEEYCSKQQYGYGVQLGGKQSLTLAEFLDRNNSVSNNGFGAVEGSPDDAPSSPISFMSEFPHVTSWVQEDGIKFGGGECFEGGDGEQPMCFAEEAQLLEEAERELVMLDGRLSEEKLEPEECMGSYQMRRPDEGRIDGEGTSLESREADSTFIMAYPPEVSNPKQQLPYIQHELGRRRNATRRGQGNGNNQHIYSPVPSMRNFPRPYEEEPVPNRYRESKQCAGGKDEQEKRGVPAVMRCFDRTKIFVKAGNGGNGVVAFRREKFVPYGGPSGGNGGEGGNVYIEVDASMNSLLPFRKKMHFRAGRGSHGQGKGREGSKGEDCVVQVPPGTLVKEVSPDSSQTEAVVLLEMTIPGQRQLLLPGGRGGRGNAAFKSGSNKAPQLAENGEEGAEMWVELELKLVADVGIIGVPNAGKSTLLSSISSAKPNIADYPFTTLLPNLGVVSLDFDASMVVADLPGLLEGAHSGIGLGHEFLRHAERCRILVHVIDGTSPQPQHEFEAVRLELKLFNPTLALKPYIVAFNKMDIPDVAYGWKVFEEYMQSYGIKALCISAATKQGTSQLIHVVYDLLKSEHSSSTSCDTSGKVKNCVDVGEMVRTSQNAPLEAFWVSCDKHQRIWQVHGAGLERFTQMTNWEYFEAVRRFQRVLDASGVSASLRDQGIQEGDTVFVGQMEFTWHDSKDMMSLRDWKRGLRGSKIYLFDHAKDEVEHCILM
ncbi:hypothetical protein O6H91_12G022500 [Diphasiastrum complanatum]|uniref:Uncharacterized protein n=1 Tax=Diphasiastrum complanatum TaxID=34168 RepID=A0ACC2BZR5_DIPCM|nr:hypothetical protein O6H91_12G022500 [Diphasiastrum complanatum]